MDVLWVEKYNGFSWDLLCSHFQRKEKSVHKRKASIQGMAIIKNHSILSFILKDAQDIVMNNDQHLENTEVSEQMKTVHFIVSESEDRKPGSSWESQYSLQGCIPMTKFHLIKPHILKDSSTSQ
jgi:hypothetical protein